MKHLEKVMQKEMTRKEFLGALGLGIVSILGMSTILGLIFGKSDDKRSNAASTYGGSVYGGSKS